MKYAPNHSIATQKETIDVWTPLYDELVSLFLETVEGVPPTVASQPDGKTLLSQNSKFEVEGGWPCKTFADDWNSRATAWLLRFEMAKREHKLSSKPWHRKSSLAQLSPYLLQCLSDPTSLSGRDVGRIRLLLARYVSKRGLPDSAQCQSARERQQRQSKTPLFDQVAAVMISRLQAYSEKDGIADLSPVMKQVTEMESALCGLENGEAIPETILRKTERCLWESIDVLVERGIIPSGDVLAGVLPQLTSSHRAAGITDASLRQLYAAIYRAFRRRRSLLLLDLQSQVRIEELPWVSAIENFRSDSLSSKELNRQTLEEVVSLALISFPQAILPNKLLQEIHTLATGAGLDIPLVDELAADIFMGRFSSKFVRAAKQAAMLLNGSLYQIYYGIDNDAVLQLSESVKRSSGSWFGHSSSTRDEFAELCYKRAGVSDGGWGSSTNGMVIEQQQVLTTQNLATLFAELQLQSSLQLHLPELARRCFESVCRRLQVNDPNWHARLIMVKNSAYAWRQMVFYLSFVGSQELDEFLDWARIHLSNQQPKFQDRFQSAFNGLIAASKGRTPGHGEVARNEGRQFLGWSRSRHWLIGS